VLAAIVCATARNHVPAVLLGTLFLLVVLAVARFGGILFALPVGVMTILAFDWYFLPRLRELGAATVLVGGLFLVMSVIVGAVTTRAGRCVVASERARGDLAAEQAALRRVATLVASGARPAEVFTAVAKRCGPPAPVAKPTSEMSVSGARRWPFPGAIVIFNGSGRWCGSRLRGSTRGGGR
jgi:K+-sensing histidine kinase KdpD